MRIVYSILFLLSLFITSCSKQQDSTVIFKEFENQEWERFEYLNGEFNIDKPSQKYDIVMEVLVSDIYPSAYEAHQNDCPLLFNLTIYNPNDNGKRSRNYKFMLKDLDGNWKADYQDGFYNFRLPIMEEINLDEKGTYKFKIENKYPKDPLQGIKSITLKCINSGK